MDEVELVLLGGGVEEEGEVTGGVIGDFACLCHGVHCDSGANFELLVFVGFEETIKFVLKVFI